MLKKISIKKQLLVIPVMIILSFIYLFLSILSNTAELEDKSTKASSSNKIIKQMLEARIAEKNFTRRKDLQYSAQLRTLIRSNLEIAQELKNSFQDKENQQLVDTVMLNINEYKTLFDKYLQLRNQADAMQEVMVKEANDVEEIAIKVREIQKTQRDKVIKNTKDITVIADEIEEASQANKIVKQLLNMRIAEKNYLRRKDIKYQDEVERSIKNITTLTLHVKDILDSPKNKKMMDNILKALEEYKKAFDSFSILRENSIVTSSKMKKEAREAETALLSLRKDQKDEKTLLQEQITVELITIFLIVGSGILLFILLILSLINKNLATITTAAKELASGEGDLTKRIHIEGENEIAEVAHYINEFIAKVQAAISESKNVGVEASSIATELSATSLEIGKRVEDESVLVQDVNSSAEQTMKESEFVDGMVKQMHELSDKSFKELQDTTEQINNLISTVKESSIKEIELAEKMEELRGSTNDVKSILELIGDIAEQTNLLSLNAAIEAARAGEHGRGFAVVADEVRKLAEGTQKSLTEINATINIVTQAVDDASDSMQTNAKEIASAAEKASSVEQSIDGVMSSIESTKTMSSESSQAVDKLKGSIGEISQKMQDLNDVSNSNARSVEEIAAAAEHQNSVIDKLSQQLSSFKV